MATVTAVAGSGAAGSAGLLSRRRIIAKTGFNRWLVPTAALAVHLCIGMAYGFSVFWLPMSELIAGGSPAQASWPGSRGRHTVRYRPLHRCAKGHCPVLKRINRIRKTAAANSGGRRFHE